jgi:hypothetical protein
MPLDNPSPKNVQEVARLLEIALEASKMRDMCLRQAALDAALLLIYPVIIGDK